MMQARKIEDFGLGRPTEKVTKLGAMILQEAADHPRDRVREKFAPFVEEANAHMPEGKSINSESVRVSEVINATGTDSDLFTTAIASFVEAAYEPVLVSRGLMRQLDIQLQGEDSIKIPREDALRTAQQINDDGTFPSEETGGYDSTTISINWYGLYTAIPLQLIEKSRVDIIAQRFEELGRAISRKVDSTVLSAWDTATTSGNNNLKNLGSSTDLSYDGLITEIANHFGLNAMTTDVVLNPTNWGILHKDATFVSGLQRSADSSGNIPFLETLGNIRFHMSQQVGDNTTYLVDRDRLGYFVDAGDIRTFDGRVDNSIQTEVLAVKPWGVSVTQPEGVYQIKDNTA